MANDGKQEINEILCSIRIPAAKIDQYKVTASPLLDAMVAVTGDTLQMHIANMNPAESVQISMLATGSPRLPARPEVALRGSGVTGTEKAETTQTAVDSFLPYSSVLVATLAVLTTGVFTWVLRLRAKGYASSSSVDSNDQRQVLAFVCRAHGLKDLAEQFSAQAHETTYWAEADRLGQVAVDSDDSGRTEAIQRALLSLPKYVSMAEVSRAIVYYNVALIRLRRNDSAACVKYLDLARETSSQEIERRLKVDPRFIAIAQKERGP